MDNNLKKAHNYLKNNNLYMQFSKEEQEIIFAQMTSELNKKFDQVISNDPNDKIYMKNVYKFIDDTIKEIYISTKHNV